MTSDEFLNLPFISAIGSFLTNIGFSQSAFSSSWTLIQIFILLAAILISKLAVRLIEEPVVARLRQIEGQRGLLRFLVILHRRAFWIFLTFQLWLAYGVLRGITWPSNSHLIRIVASLVTTWLVISILSRLIKNRFFSRVIATVAWVIAALYILGLLEATQTLLDGAAFSIGNVRVSTLSILKSAILLGFLLWASLSLSTFLTNALQKNEDLSPSLKVLLSKVVRFVLLAFAVFISLGAVGIDFTALAVFSGAVGIGIGLGLQKIVSNFISGIILLLDKSIKPGDVIEIDTVSGSTYGWVQHLGARYTAVRTRDGTETLIPNETFIDSPVTNWTHTNKAVRRKLPIGVSYETDVEKAIELCIDAVSDMKRVLKVPKPVCLVKGFGDSSVDLELRFWINDPEGGVANISSQVYLEVWKRFQKENIEIPFPQRDLNIRSSVPFEIKSK